MKTVIGRLQSQFVQGEKQEAAAIWLHLVHEFSEEVGCRLMEIVAANATPRRAMTVLKVLGTMTGSNVLEDGDPRLLGCLVLRLVWRVVLGDGDGKHYAVEEMGWLRMTEQMMLSAMDALLAWI